MADVVSMPGCGPLTPRDGMPPVANVVEMLEKALQEARSGDIRAAGLALVRTNGVTATAYAYDHNEATSHFLVAATAYLHHRYISEKMESSEEP